jgi:hypothetical protein
VGDVGAGMGEVGVVEEGVEEGVDEVGVEEGVGEVGVGGWLVA